MKDHDEIEAEREHNEGLAYEEYWEAVQREFGGRTKPCPACGMPMFPEQIMCADCLMED